MADADKPFKPARIVPVDPFPKSGRVSKEQAEGYHGQATRYSIALAAAYQEIERLNTLVAEQGAANLSLRQTVGQTSAALAKADKGPKPITKIAHMDTAIPTTYAAFEGWRALHLGGYVSFSKDAIKGIKESDYAHPESVFYGLLALKTLAQINMEHGDKIKLMELLTDLLHKGHLEKGRSINPRTVGQYGSEYYAQPPEGGERVLLNEHLSRGNDRDSRNCLRIYYREMDDGTVFVGKATKHLTNSMT